MDVAMKKNSKSPISENGSQLIYDANHNIILDDEKVCIRYDVMGRAYKRCGYCKKWKPVGSFEKSSSPLSKDGYGSFCDVCRSKQKKGVVPQAEGKPVQTEKKATAQTNTVSMQENSSRRPSDVIPAMFILWWAELRRILQLSLRS